MRDRSEFKKAKRVVVKIGSSQLCERESLSYDRFRALANQVGQIRRRGVEVILVTSGAVAAGMTKLGFTARPTTVRLKQVCASAGQVSLMAAWDKALAVFDLKCAQILLTADDLADRRRFLNARNTMISLVDMGVVPIVNENDTVAVEELKVGDNDTLGSMVASLVEADLFINLTDTDGLYESDPRSDPSAALVREVSEGCGPGLERLAGEGGPLGAGGMYTKVRAASRLAERGLASVIANGRARDVLARLIDGEELGTFFRPTKNQRKARKHWLAFAARPKGALSVDPGAAAALVEKGKSLLPSGIMNLTGLFDVGDPVSIVGADQEELGIGLSNYSAPEVEKIMGRPSAQIESILGYTHSEEIVHRDNLVIFKAAQ
ncbi:MAG: glutamate 5-kinase [Deltaproteobacteria bacterium]|jgi:glutamate 5-kinase|nr:glutamate 5-kinase [Deltaproteobacteria bacterium]